MMTAENIWTHSFRMNWYVLLIIIVALILISLILKYQVRLRTAELVRKHRDLEQEMRRRSQVEDVLREREYRYRLIVEHQNDLVITFDADQRITFVCPMYCQTFGKSEEELLGHHFFPLIHEDDHARVKKSLEDLKKPSYTCVHEERVKTIDGWRWFSWSNRAIVDEQGQITEVIAVGRDVTDRKKAEQALQLSEARYRKLFDEAIDGIGLADAETGIILDCNQALLQLVQREKSEVVGQHQRILHPPEEVVGHFSSSFVRHRTEKDGQVLETYMMTKTGELKPVEIKANILEWQGRKILQGFVRDITVRKQAEEELHTYQSHLEKLVEQRTEHLQQEILERKHVESALRESEQRLRLIKEVAVASNLALNQEESLQRAIESVCHYTDWPVGHVYQLSKDQGSLELVPTDIWYLSQPGQFEKFRDVTGRIRFSTGIGLPGRVLTRWTTSLDC